MEMSLFLCLHCIVLIHTASGIPGSHPLLRRLAEISYIPIASRLYPSTSASNFSSEAKDPHHDVKINLIFARLQARLLATDTAQRFFARASVYGLPSYDNLLFRDNYILSYDGRLKHPSWVIENFAGRQSRAADRFYFKGTFRTDLNLPENLRSRYRDYLHTGYDRGHLAPVCDSMSSKEQVNEACLMSNIAPQVRNLNGGGCAWTRLESYALYLAHQSEDFYVISGTLYMPTTSASDDPGSQSVMVHRVIGSKRLIGVPTHYYKIMLSKNEYEKLSMEAFLLPNSEAVDRSARIEQFQVDIDKDLPEIERTAGLRFFELIDRNRIVRSRMIRDFGSNSGT